MSCFSGQVINPKIALHCVQRLTEWTCRLEKGRRKAQKGSRTADHLLIVSVLKELNLLLHHKTFRDMSGEQAVTGALARTS